MIAAWLLYSTVVGGLAAAAAVTGERVCSALGRPVRFAWCAALAVTLLLSGVALLRLDRPDAARATAVAELVAEEEAERQPVATPAPGRIAQAVAALRGAQHVTYAALARIRAPAQALTIIWTATSLLLLLLFGGVLLHVRRARRHWRRIDVGEERVYVAPHAGPALIGLRRPAIVVPEWLAVAPEADLRLVVRHEQEHRSARDHLLLATACLLACALPLNPAIWWMVRRLRLAVEIDCDARVLDHGASTGEYGALLLAVAARGTPQRLAAPALSDATTQLERRIIAMTRSAHSPSRSRIAAGTLAAGILAIAACSADMPTAAEIERLDVNEAQARIDAAGLLRTSDGTADPLFIVDEVVVSRNAARLLAPENIASIEIIKGAAAAAYGDAGANGVVKVTTRSPGSDPAVPAHIRRGRTADAEDAPGARVRVRTADGATLSDPLIIVDGEPAPPGFQLRNLDPASIEAVEVIKGEAAVRAYGSRAALGAIRITLKK